jgi:hypothetical protein
MAYDGMSGARCSLFLYEGFGHGTPPKVQYEDALPVSVWK